MQRRLCASYILLLFFLAAFVSSCSNTRHLQPGQQILKSNKVKVKSSSTNLKKIRKNIEQNLTIESKLASLARQQPNKRTLGIGLSLRMYNLFYTEKDSGAWYFLMTQLGNPPVLFDSTTLPTSAHIMHDYLTSKGYLFPEVTYSYKVTKRKKAKVSYHVVTGPLYTIDTVFFPTDSTKLDLIVAASRFKTQLISGDAYDSDRLGQEQKRIHREFLDIGYFYFRRDFIFFEVDTNLGGHRVNVYVNTLEVDTAPEQQQYTVRDIYLYPDFNPQYDIDMVKFDTIIYDGMRFLTTKRFVDPDVLASAVFMVRGALYSRTSFDCTFNRISDLGIFKFANARFNDVGGNMLDCRLYLQPAKKHQIGTELGVGTVADNLSSGLQVSYLSKNLNHRANTIDLSLSGGIQIPAFPVFRADSIFYNVNAQINYRLPKFAFPFLKSRISCYNNPVTTISLKANYFQQTNYYSLQSYGISYQMEWKEVDFPLKKFIAPIFGVSYVFPTYSDSFAKRLETDPFLRQSFSKQFIPSAGFAYIFSNQYSDRKRNYTYLRFDFEIAGNVLYGINSLLIKFPQDDSGNYQIFGISYANYVRTQFDIRRYLVLTQNRTLVLRFSPGVGIPYWNASVMPYVKQFYLGGTNSMRAWRVRSLGPGSFRDTTNSYNSAGDIKLEANIEYRFSIFARLKGAAFIDAGNIWLLRSDTLTPGGTFYFDKFTQQIAIGTGIGFRLDFSYFILRLDMATRVYDPSFPAGERWVIQKFQLAPDGKLFSDVTFQLGVGYPF